MESKRSELWALGGTSMFRGDGLGGEKVTLLRRFTYKEHQKSELQQWLQGSRGQLKCFLGLIGKNTYHICILIGLA